VEWRWLGERRPKKVQEAECPHGDAEVSNSRAAVMPFNGTCDSMTRIELVDLDVDSARAMWKERRCRLRHSEY